MTSLKILMIIFVDHRKSLIIHFGTNMIFLKNSDCLLIFFLFFKLKSFSSHHFSTDGRGGGSGFLLSILCFSLAISKSWATSMYQNPWNKMRGSDNIKLRAFIVFATWKTKTFCQNISKEIMSERIWKGTFEVLEIVKV